MEDNEDMSFEDILFNASEITDIDQLDNYMREQNALLVEDEQLDEGAIQEAIDALTEEQIKKFGPQALEFKLQRMKPSEDGLENLRTGKQLIQRFLMEAAPSEVDESIFIMEDKLSLTAPQKRILTKFYKEEKRKYENKKRQLEILGSGDYDMDSVSGRAKIVREFADIYIERKRLEGTPIKYINKHIRMYKDGIYPESEEVIDFIQHELIDIGLANQVNLTPGLVDQIIKLIQMACPVSMQDCEPDSDFVVVLNNGLLDTRDWKFRPFDPDKVYFSKIPVDYLPDTPKPENFIKFIDSCFKGNEAQKDLLQEAFGYTLMKTYKYQDIFYFLGDGGNGKGSAVAILRMLLGEGNVTAFSLHQLTDGEHVDYNVAMMHGKHANICGDVGSARVRNTDTLKKLSSNTDPVSGRHVRERPFEFINYAKMFFLMNRAPEMDAHTMGDKRRIRTINFINSFSEQKGEIKDIHKVIIEAGELPGILLWAIEGLKRLEANKGFSDTRTIIQRSIEYDRKANTVRFFVEECLYEDPGSIIPNAMMYQRYESYRKSVGGAELGERELKKAILTECKDAGWNGVTNVQKRSTQLPEPMRDFMENVLGKKSGRCFFGVSLVQEDPQKEITAFVDPKVSIAENDAEMYEMLTMDEEMYTNGATKTDNIP
ncbi:MAG: phage/plasmid primase, P4 family [Candidatus Pacebacteria bacterium]|nr:phage/plasmid primase, P4 family [Candidatus Paceibacterota bacterium]